MEMNWCPFLLTRVVLLIFVTLAIQNTYQGEGHGSQDPQGSSSLLILLPRSPKPKYVTTQREIKVITIG